MPRPHRTWIPGGIYHITARGNDRQRIFLDDGDFQQYVIQLRQWQDELPYRLLAYALMPNHVHLVVQLLPQTTFSVVMQRLGSSYAQYFNERYNRVGHVYQGRFYSNFVNRDSYLREVTRYVHLNPVRAQLCRRPDDYPWSSYRVYLGRDHDPLGLVECAGILRLFGSSDAERVEQYRQFVEELAEQEQQMDAWLLRLRRNKLIPPAHWFTQKGSDPFPRTKGV